MDADTRERICDTLGVAVAAATRITGGGYSPAERWRVTLADGTSCFAKVATAGTAHGLRTEADWYRWLGPRPFLPAFLGLTDAPHPTLVLELLDGRWLPPWGPADVDRVRALLADLAAIAPPPGTRRLVDLPHEGWADVARDPGPLLALGLCSRGWADRCLPALVAAEAATAVSDPPVLAHFDVRSDNLCLLADRAVLVDWNHALAAPAALDRAFWAPSLRLEGGPLPEALGDDLAPWAAWVAGFFAARAGLAPIPEAPRVRWIQLRQLRIALPWACRVLGLPPPDVRWASATIDAADADLAAARIDEAAWFAGCEEVLVDAYLSTDDPRAGSGKSGDEADWRWSREIVLDAVDRDAIGAGGCALLDVGCANGYLLDSLVRWGAERGLAIDPFGLEISDRLARVARTDHPALADRIACGNVLTWDPPRRYDLVHTGLDYVPHPRRRALVDRIRAAFLRPGGRMVLRAERVRAHPVLGLPGDPAAQLHAIGIVPDGVLEVRHPATGEVRRTAWVRAA